MTHPLFTRYQTNFRRHIKTSKLASGKLHLMYSSCKSWCIDFHCNQQKHFLEGKPGGESEHYPHLPLQPLRKCLLWNLWKMLHCSLHRVRWKLPSSNVARFKFLMVDTDALPHVVHLISVKLEGAQRTQTSVNTEQFSKLVSHLKTLFQKFRFDWLLSPENISQRLSMKGLCLLDIAQYCLVDNSQH